MSATTFPTTPTIPTAATDSLARSVERLSAIIADLTATNTQLLSDLRARDAQLAGRDQQVRARDERILALSGEVKRLSLSRERERVDT
jgi:Tfp pilus assembly protein FimV